MDILKQSTAATIVMGPMLDSTDGNTQETGLTISQADIRLSKNGGAFAQTNNAAGATHMEVGNYSVPLDTTDTGTLGKLRVSVHESGALAVWREFMIVPANVYDSLVLGTDVLTADITQIGGDAQSATDLKDFADAGYDPATNKVQGVVLTDTVTTNTDMRGTDSAALAATALTDVTWTDAKAAFLDHSISTVDTNVDTLLTRVTAAVALASVCTETRLAELDAANLPTDIADIPTVAEFNARTLVAASYFDPAADTVANVTNVATLTGHTVQTGDSFARIGALGVGLTALPWNSAWDTEIQSECNDAMVALNLDHLLAVADADDVVDNSIIAKLASLGATADWSTFVNTTDSLQAIRDRGDAAWSAAASNPNVLIDTTIAAVTDQTHFTLTAGSDIDDAYKDQAIVVYDASNNDYPSVRKVSAYTGATKTITLDSAPDFTILAGDGVKTFVTAPGTTAPTAGQVADAVLDELVADHVVAGSLSKTVSDVLTDTGTTLPAALATAQTDLDTITGADGVTLATLQALYAPNKVIPDVAGTAAALHTTTDGKVDVVDTNVDAILIDTNKLQTDWANAGRLDTILDACALEATVAALNNISTADVNTEVDTALSDYDPPTNTEMVAAFTEIKGATWAAGTDTLEHIRNKQTDIETDTTEIGVAGAGLTALGDSRIANLDTTISSRLAPAGTLATVTNLTNAPSSGDLTATMKASVNAEVSDVIKTDTISEMAQGAPAATPTLEDAIMYMYMYFRNEVTQTSSTLSLKNNAGTVIAKATVSDDATTFTKGEMVSGP